MATKKTEPIPDESAQAVLTYEQARDELVSIVGRLESGDETLADSMALFTRGEELAKICQQYLIDAKQMVEQAQTVTD